MKSSCQLSKKIIRAAALIFAALPSDERIDALMEKYLRRLRSVCQSTGELRQSARRRCRSEKRQQDRPCQRLWLRGIWKRESTSPPKLFDLGRLKAVYGFAALSIFQSLSWIRLQTDFRGFPDMPIKIKIKNLIHPLAALTIESPRRRPDRQL